MSGFNRAIAVFYAFLALYRLYRIFDHKPTLMHFFGRLEYGDAAQVVAGQPGVFGLVAFGLGALVVSIVISVFAARSRDARNWMSVSIVIGAVWLVAFVMQGLPPPYNPALWVMGIVYRVNTVVIGCFLLGIEVLLRVLASDRQPNSKGAL